jgi:hypothetical protein
MGATYLSMQLRTSDRERAIAALEEIASANAGSSLKFYVARAGGWVAGGVPKFHTGAGTHGQEAVGGTRQLPWFKVGAPRIRRGKERETLATKLEALTDVCDVESRARLLAILADPTGVTFSSELLRAVCDIVGIRNAFTSFEYLQRGERESLEMSVEPRFVPANVPMRED